MAVKIRDERYAMCGRTRADIKEHQGYHAGTTYLLGTIATPHGMARVTSSQADRYARVDFFWRGQQHIRTWRGASFTKLGLARKAREFVDAIVGSR